jgi:hypothetical protein
VADAGAGDVAEAEPKEGKKRKAKPAKTEEIRDRNRRLREQAVESRRERRARERGAPARGLDASEMVDDALARSTQATVGFLKRYFGVIQWLIVLGIAVGVGWQIYDYRHERQTAQVSDGLMKGVRASLGLVGVDRSAEPKELKDLVNPLPDYATVADRTKAASAAYKEFLEKAEGGSNPALFAKLGLAGAAYDTGKYDEAKKLYEKHKIPIASLAERTRHVIEATFKGKRVVIFSGGEAKDAESVLGEVRELAAGGSFGSIMGRNAFQRTKGDALKLLGDVMQIYKSAG